MIRKPYLCMGVLAILLTTGCAVFTDPNKPHTIKDGDHYVILMQADRRAVFTFGNDSMGTVCPEPSPDVRADVESAIKGLISGSATTPAGVSAEAKAEIDATRKLVTAALLKRSQGLQVLRDLLFQACLANLRGDLPGPQYMNFVTRTLPRLTSTLITTELLSSRSSTGQALPKDVVDSIVKYQLLGVASASP